MTPALSLAAVASRALVTAAVVGCVAALLLLLWTARTVLLLGFLAVLLAIFFQGLAEAAGRLSRLPYWINVTMVLSLTAALVAIAAYFRAPAIADQFGTLQEELPQSIDQLRAELRNHSWGRHVLARLPDGGQIVSAQGAGLQSATRVFSTTFAAFGHVIFVFFTFLFVVFQPRQYRHGIEKLLPARQRYRAGRILDHAWQTLWWWLAARGLAMALVGIVTTVGLLLLDVPLALTLGLIAAFLDFVPNFGPIVAAIPAILLATVQGPEKAIYVALLYLVVQTLEGNIITPIAQKKAIEMPPVIVIASQLALGGALGILGFVLATPLVALAMVLIRELYIEEETDHEVNLT